jgi:beta-lactamase regulating signal transducer with metallopeptidase domain
MTFPVRVAVLTLAALAVNGLATAYVIPLMFPSRRIRGTQRRAQSAFLTALMPGAAAVGGMTIAFFSQVLFEPRTGEERFGVMVLAMAVVGAALLLMSICRTALLWRGTRILKREWIKHAEPISLPGVQIPVYRIQAPFPVVAIIGVWSPVLVVASQVLEACTSDELSAIAAHERAHIEAKDNFRRLLLAVLPMGFEWRLSRPQGAAAVWHASAEEAADDRATRGEERARLVLAEALLRVARLARHNQLDPTFLASALYEGDGIEQRVLRLLAPREPEPSETPYWICGLAIAAITVALFCGGFQSMMEVAVTWLP